MAKKKTKSIKAKRNQINSDVVNYRARLLKNLNKIEKIQSSSGKKVRYYNKEKNKIDTELSSIKNKIYRYNSRINKISGKGSKKKKEALTKERDRYIKDTKKTVSSLSKRKKSMVSLSDTRKEISLDRRRLKNELNELSKLIEIAKKEGNSKEFDRLIGEKEVVFGLLDQSHDALTSTSSEQESVLYTTYKGQWDDGFKPHPLSGMSVWEAEEFMIDQEFNEWKWFIINDTLMSGNLYQLALNMVKDFRYSYPNSRKKNSITPSDAKVLIDENEIKKALKLTIQI